ncbi:MAG: hypothetical protein CMH57_00905 [Myxococcales bacterium]|nr:hypothetical protein [Myxococcales bacterium]
MSVSWQAHAQEAEEVEEDEDEVEMTIPLVQSPVAGEPKRFVPSRWGDVLYRDGAQITSLDTGKEVMRLADQDAEYGFSQGSCHSGDKTFMGCGQVSIQRNVKTFEVTETRKVGNKTKQVKVTKKVSYNYTRVSFIDNDGTYVRLVEVKDSVPSPSDPALGTRYRAVVHGAYVDKENRPTMLYAVNKTVTTPGKKKGQYNVQSTTEEWIWRGGTGPTTDDAKLYSQAAAQKFTWGAGSPISRESGAGAGHETRVNPRLQFVELNGEVCMIYASEGGPGPLHFQCANQATHVEVVEEAMYDFRAEADKEGWLYVFYHEPTEETAKVASSKDGRQWRHALVDTKESGWQMDTAVHGDQVYLLYYYFRNSFNKGLKVATFKGGAIAQDPVTIVRRSEYNTGWYPSLAISANGSMWMTWWDNVLEKTRVWSHLKHPREMGAHVVEDTGGWEDGYKNWALQAGAGGWYTFWNLVDIAPSTEDTGNLELDPTEYTLDQALLAATSLEAEFMGWSLAMSYAQSIIDDAKDELNEAGGENIQRLTGSIKVDKLFPGHDVKVQFVYGKYEGTATAGAGVLLNGSGANNRAQLPIDTNYVDAQALFLNKWRVKYGLALTRYELPMVLHTWHAPAESEAYFYTGSFFRQTSVTDIKALAGYSTLDYISKYENYYSGLFFDGYLDAGVSLLSFDEIQLQGAPGADPESSSFTFVGRTTVHVGYLLFSRWKGARGLGFYLRPAYLAEGSFVGLPTKPDDRDSDNADDAETRITPGLLSVRHGPWFDLGIVW